MDLSASSMELGALGFSVLPELATQAKEYQRALRQMHAGVFLRSESTSVAMGVPQELSPELATQCSQLVQRFGAFADALVKDYFQNPQHRETYLVNPLLEPLFEIEANAHNHVALNRIDCVLRDDGRLLVIENNSVGICAYHYRNLLYLIRGLWRSDLREAAQRIEWMTRELSTGFRRHYKARAKTVRERPTLGMLIVKNHMRAGKIMFRDAFERNGWDFVCACPDDLELKSDALLLAGKKVDLLWTDFHFYLGYQATRYSRDRFPSKMAAFDHVADEVATLLGNRRFLDLLRSGTVVNMSPATAYLALAKPLLSRVHHGSPLLPETELAWLRGHVAVTYSLEERQAGILTLDEAIERRQSLVAKPALFGGSVGVVLGKNVSEAAWREQLTEIWSDRAWAIQEFEEPVRGANQDWLSVGLMGLTGQFAGAIVRTSSNLTVSARDAAFLPALPPK